MPKPVLLVRADGNENDAEALGALGIAAVADPYLSITGLDGDAALAAAGALLADLDSLGQGDWLIATSLNGLKFWGMAAWQLTGRSAVAEAMAAARERGVRFAAIGAATAQKYSQFGIDVDFVPTESYGEALAAQLIEFAGAGEAAAATASEGATAGSGSTPRALIPAGNLAMKTLSEALASAGWAVTSHVIYQTAAVTERPASVGGVAADEFSAVLFRSPSAAKAFAQWNRVAPGVESAAAALPVICGGRTTAQAARELGLNVVAIAADTTPAGIARAIFETVTGETPATQTEYNKVVHHEATSTNQGAI